MEDLPVSSAATKLEGSWSGTTTVSVPPEGIPLFALFLADSRCVLRDALAPTMPAETEDICALRCIRDKTCLFYSFGSAAGSGSTAECTLYPFCIGEPTEGFNTKRMYAGETVVDSVCKIDLTVHGLVLDLAIHSCGGDSNPVSNGLRRSAQVGALRGIILPADSSAISTDLTSCGNALAAVVAPCQGKLEQVQSQTGSSQEFSYWRMQVRWTASSRDRIPGDLDNIILSFGLSDGAQDWPLQFVMNPIAFGEPDPVISFNQDQLPGESSKQPTQLASRFRLQLTTIPKVPRQTDATAINLLAATKACNESLLATMSLRNFGFDCAAAVSAFYPESTLSLSSESRFTEAANECGNPCLVALTNATNNTVNVCKAAWDRASQSKARLGQNIMLADDGSPILAISDPGIRFLLESLLRFADAAYLLDTACSSNWRNARCTHSLDGLVGCPLAIPTRASSGIAYQTWLLPTFAGKEGCGNNCSVGLKEYIYTQGCCTATMAVAEARWANTVVGASGLGPRFWVDWGENSPLELFRVPDACPNPMSMGLEDIAAARAVGVDCQGILCGLAGIWPGRCCNTVRCANGGTKVPPL